ncbi:GNAT family N-acetyltransferase [Mucisphaera calidilacus]|uniref:Acetyltransferase (GNAT) family protein n=1 Tax=Mucisphaera calidilacus TaxID=2527982 RepID=A0A518C153_9BACT|nr:N-acetyltransferase [Mucisphaera calidilacus]QDU72955.1 Acetyltransferase (GNAT) family protein [Mucisphaera calidilacus]
MTTLLRPHTKAETPDTLNVSRAAFPGDPGEDIAQLVNELLHDPTAQPRLSLVALIDNTIAGHALFTAVTIQHDNTPRPITASILAPLAVLPDHQNQGLGGQLVQHGLNHLREQGTDLLFVLGHPDYYPRHGFTPAGTLGYNAPYPIAPENADAWMVQTLRPDFTRHAPGTVRCADALMHERHWVE